jgi:hypothetical protein
MAIEESNRVRLFSHLELDFAGPKKRTEVAPELSGGRQVQVSL